MLRSVKFLVCSEGFGGVSFNWAIRPLGGDGNPDMAAAAVTSDTQDYTSPDICSQGYATVWTNTGAWPLTQGSQYAFVLSYRAPSNAAMFWRW